jgi:replication factor C subunit 3/5
VNCTDDGVEAILRLSGGDMRKCLNILQATSMAYPVVDATNVYLCTGNPLPADIRFIFEKMLNLSFAEAHAGALQFSLASSPTLTYTFS